jgi:hypothetical protein
MEAHDPQRRTVLRGTLAAGVTLMLFGCKAKQDERPPAPQTSPAPMSEAPAGAAPSAKMSQAQAQYQGQPKGPQKCANCTNFIASSNTCKVVEGQVIPEGWCIAWVAV